MAEKMHCEGVLSAGRIAGPCLGNHLRGLARVEMLVQRAASILFQEAEARQVKRLCRCLNHPAMGLDRRSCLRLAL